MNATGTGRVTRYFRLPVEYEKSAGAKELFLDASGVIWVATQSGLLLLDPATGSTHLLRSNLHYPYSLPNNSVWSIFPDPDGGVWVGTYGGKLAYMTLADNGVKLFQGHAGRAEPSHLSAVSRRTTRATCGSVRRAEV